MTNDEALAFLKSNQPMPADKAGPPEIFRRYDEVREHFLSTSDDRCVPLFLGSFGEGSGFGIYQLVEDVLRRYPRKLVVDALRQHLGSKHQGVRNWCLLLGVEYADRSLVPFFARSLRSDDPEERLWAAHCMQQVYVESEDRADVEACLAEEPNEDITALLEEMLRSGRGDS